MTNTQRATPCSPVALEARVAIRLIVSAMILTGSAPAAAQSPAGTVEVPLRLCASCSIALEEVAFVRGGEGEEGPGLSRYASLAVLSDGRIVIGSTTRHGHGQVSEFDPSGRFVRVLDHRGQGELRVITHINVGMADTIFVLDAVSRRMNRFAPNGQFVDQTLLPGGVSSVVPLGDRRLFASATIPTRMTAGFPLHVIDTLGVLASFGEEKSYASSGGAGAMVRLLASTPQDRVWAAQFLSYRIESWTTDGRLRDTWVRNVNWFPPAESPPRVPVQVAPRQPTITGLFDDGANHLWVFVSVGDEDWSPKDLTPSSVPGMFEEASNLDPFLDTIIEVIDIERSSVVARLRDDRALVPVPGGYLAYYEEDQSGLPTYRILRPRIVGSEARGGAR